MRASSRARHTGAPRLYIKSKTRSPTIDLFKLSRVEQQHTQPETTLFRRSTPESHPPYAPSSRPWLTGLEFNSNAPTIRGAKRDQSSTQSPPS